MIRMKALRSFGVPGSNEGKVRRGREFMVANEHRAMDLELADPALAYRIPAIMPEPVNRMIPTASNEAADAGPFVSRGGTTGATEPLPSSLPDRPRRRRRSTKSVEQDLLSSPSRKTSDSSLMQPSSTGVTGLGGN